MELERRELGKPDERRAVVAQAVVDLALVSPAPDRGRLDPVGSVARAALLVEEARLDAVRIALQRQRALLKVREDDVGQPGVVVDHLTLREPGRGPQHLVEVGELEPAAVDFYLAALALLRDLDLPWELLAREPDFEPDPDLARERRFWPPSPSAPAPRGSPLTAARLSSSAAIRSGALVGFGSSDTASTTSSPRALRSITSSSSLRYSSRYFPGSNSLDSESINCL